MTEMAKVRKNLRKKREEKGWTAYELSKRTGITTSHIYNIESGINAVSSNKLGVLAEALGCTLAELLSE